MSTILYPDGGRMAAYRLALITYLNDACAPYTNPALTGAIDWGYPPDEAHTIGQNPKGTVLLGTSTSQLGTTLGSEETRAYFSLKLALRLSHGDQGELMDLLNSWEFALIFTILPPLTREGITGTYFINGINVPLDKAFWKTRFETTGLYPTINQESGGHDSQIVILGKWREANSLNSLMTW